MGRDVVSAKLDVIFKKLFTENTDLLHSFVRDMGFVDKLSRGNPL